MATSRTRNSSYPLLFSVLISSSSVVVYREQSLQWVSHRIIPFSGTFISTFAAEGDHVVLCGWNRDDCSIDVYNLHAGATNSGPVKKRKAALVRPGLWDMQMLLDGFIGIAYKAGGASEAAISRLL